MKNKGLSMLMAVVLVFSFSLFLGACAKKQVQVGKEVAKPTEAVSPAEGAAPKEEVKEEIVEKVVVTETEEAKAREAERQARLRELQEAQRLADTIRQFESEKIYFDFDKADIKPAGEVVLKRKAAFLRKHPEYSVLIAGNCDERGTQEYNLALGERRAYAAKNYLMALGIAGDRISTVSYGEERPVDPGHNEAAWAKNRRDEFTLIKR